MTAIINIIVAAVLIFQCLQAANRRGKWDSIHENLLVFVLMTGMFQIGGYTLFLNLSAWRLLIWIFIVLFVLFLRNNPKYFRPSKTINLPILFYSLFLCWCVYEWTRAPDLMFGLRAFLKLLYPFLILMLARKAAQSKNFYQYLQKIAIATLVISIFTSGISERIPYLVYNPFLKGIFWPRATFADHAAIIIGVILILIYCKTFSFKLKRIYMLALSWLFLSPIAVGNRTGFLAACAAISGFFFIKYKAKAVPVILAVFFTGVFVFTSIDSFKKETFYNTRNVSAENIYKWNIDFENINSSGRFNMWDIILEKLYNRNKMLGSGLGAQQHEMYIYTKYYGGLKVIHSDYVILLCDTGNIGLLLYLMFPFTALFTGFKYAWSGTTKTIKTSGILVVTAWLACLCAMAFDNVFNYSLAVHSLPFAFTGMLLGIINNKERLTN